MLHFTAVVLCIVLLLVAVADRAAAVVASGGNNSTMPPIFRCRGTFFACGQQVGAQAKSQIQARMLQSDVRDAARLAATPTGKQVMARFQQNMLSFAPELVAEMKGVAAGAGLSYDDIFLLNSLDEFGALESNTSSPTPGKWEVPSCTDVWSNSASPVIGHNEDNIREISDLCYFVDATIVDATGKTVLQRWRAFAYPGNTAGNMFGYTVHGLVLTDNFVFVERLAFSNAIPSNLRARACYGAKSARECLAILASMPGGSSSCLNVLDTKPSPPVMMSVETNPVGDTLGVRFIPSAATSQIAGTPPLETWQPHTNMFVYLDNSTGSIGQVDESSVVRMARLRQMVRERGGAVPSNVTDVVHMLGDTHNAATFPIYREGAKIDSYIRTLATFVVDVASKKVFVWSLKNPKLNPPDAVWDMALE